MSVINESNVEKVFNFIKDFQKREGRSPSFRQIAKGCGFSSLSLAHKYVLILERRNLIEKNEFGKIIIPHNLSKGQTIVAPLVGQVACGSPILAEENIEETFQLPTNIFGNNVLYSLRAKGDSMIGVGIFDGDLIFYHPCSDAESGEIVVALIGDSATVKTLRKKKGSIILHPENPAYEDIIEKDVVIQGVVKHVIHSF